MQRSRVFNHHSVPVASDVARPPDTGIVSEQSSAERARENLDLTHDTGFGIDGCHVTDDNR